MVLDIASDVFLAAMLFSLLGILKIHVAEKLHRRKLEVIDNERKLTVEEAFIVFKAAWLPEDSGLQDYPSRFWPSAKYDLKKNKLCVQSNIRKRKDLWAMYLIAKACATGSIKAKLEEYYKIPSFYGSVAFFFLSLTIVIALLRMAPPPVWIVAMLFLSMGATVTAALIINVKTDFLIIGKHAEAVKVLIGMGFVPADDSESIDRLIHIVRAYRVIVMSLYLEVGLFALSSLF